MFNIALLALGGRTRKRGGEEQKTHNKRHEPGRWRRSAGAAEAASRKMRLTATDVDVVILHRDWVSEGSQFVSSNLSSTTDPSFSLASSHAEERERCSQAPEAACGRAGESGCHSVQMGKGGKNDKLGSSCIMHDARERNQEMSLSAAISFFSESINQFTSASLAAAGRTFRGVHRRAK